MFLYLIIALFLIALHAGLWMLFTKANRAGWEALIPIYRECCILKLTGRPIWWIIIMLIPIIGFFVLFSLYIDFAKCYGKRSFWEITGTLAVPFLVFPLWGLDKDTNYLGQSASTDFRRKYPYVKTPVREWADALIFAMIAATFIRSFFLEAFMIPTGSMERTLKVGDFLFVSKVHYGIRLPMTLISFPFAHNTMMGMKSYWEGIELDYRRLPKLESIKHNDIVVFNYPADTVNNRPVDKKDNYIKRTIGLPGDTISLTNTQVYVNGKTAWNAPERQMEYYIYVNDQGINTEKFESFEIENSYSYTRNMPTYFLTPELKKTLENWSGIDSIVAVIDPANDGNGNYQNSLFPAGAQVSHTWSQDNYGPIIIPKRDWTVHLTTNNWPIYERAIRVYEKTPVENRNGVFYLDNKQITTYTFKMDYYWMMGDNRHNSLDSRYWGFVPEDHIVGKPLVVWLSIGKQGNIFQKIRWNRIFHEIN